MRNLVYVELKKLRFSKLLWMIPAGAILPPIIVVLTLLDVDGIDWKNYLHSSMDTFNILILLVFVSFTSFIWAREYEERMMEVTLLYPYPKYKLLLAKLSVMAIIITVTVFLWTVSTGCIGGLYLKTRMEDTVLNDLLKLLVPMIVMHFLLITVTFFITIILKNILAGAILGVIAVAFCEALGEYRNNDIVSSIQSSNPIIKMFALFDKRIGKRTLEKMKYEIKDEPEWIQCLYEIRRGRYN